MHGVQFYFQSRIYGICTFGCDIDDKNKMNDNDKMTSYDVRVDAYIMNIRCEKTSIVQFRDILEND